MSNNTTHPTPTAQPTQPTFEELLDQFGSKKDVLRQILERVHMELADKVGDELAALKTRNTALEDQVSLLEQKVQADTISLAHALKSIVTSGTPKDKLDASPPSPFEGKPEEVEPFLAAARLYASLKPNAFSSEKQRMLWLLSYFTSTRSEPWARGEVAAIEAGTNAYKTYTELEELIKTSFSSVSRMEEARHKLKSMKLGQKEGLGAFVNRFRPEAEAAKFGDEATAYFFSSALTSDLVLQLTTLNQGVVPTKSTEWYKVCQTYIRSRKGSRSESCTHFQLPLGRLEQHFSSPSFLDFLVRTHFILTRTHAYGCRWSPHEAAIDLLQLWRRGTQAS